METNNLTTKPVNKVLYTAKSHTTGGREGSSRSSDGNLDIKLTAPGSKGSGTNPEQLFAAGWSGCFIASMRKAAYDMKVKFPEDAHIDTEVDLVHGEDGAKLQARLNIPLPDIEHEVALAIAEAAHHICPYSKAIRGNIDVETNVV
jgi:Ohr subfamily peroxiredoxin